MDTNKIYKYYFFLIVYLFAVVAVFKVILLIVSVKPPTPDFKESIDIGERGALFLAVITGLVFTYADALDSSKKKDIIKSGEAFFKSFLTFIIGMIFSIGLRSALMNPTNPLGLSESFLYVAGIATFLLFLIALITILISGAYFAIGITGLLAAFRQE